MLKGYYVHWVIERFCFLGEGVLRLTRSGVWAAETGTTVAETYFYSFPPLLQPFPFLIFALLASILSPNSMLHLASRPLSFPWVFLPYFGLFSYCRYLISGLVAFQGVCLKYLMLFYYHLDLSNAICTFLFFPLMAFLKDCGMRERLLKWRPLYLLAMLSWQEP